MQSTRRGSLKGLLGGSLLLPVLTDAANAAPASDHRGLRWAPGIEGQRKADLGDGTFLNPIIAGDHPDPTVLKDGDDYYMTFSSFVSYPGVVIWHSRDLVNWTPIGPALKTLLGSVWAMDLIKHDGRYFIYIPAIPFGANAQQGVYVIWADDIRGPWSEPIQMFAPEGPKLLRRGDWFYLITAVGGTSGPPTSHMVIAARSKSIHGPWEHCPHNPLVRTVSENEKWWSRGHASLVEGPADDWWMIYHGYENGFRTLGRQTLMEPIEWTADGWFRAKGGDLSKPIPKPAGGEAGPAGYPLSDDFTTDKFGVQWAFHNPAADEMSRVRREPGAIVIAGKGTAPRDCSPLAFIAGDLGYEATATLDILGQGEGGLLLFYSERGFAGIGFTGGEMRTFIYGEEQTWMRAPLKTSSVSIRVRNDRNIVTWSYSHDGGTSWTQHPWQMEVSGLHHNVFGGFLSLKPAVYSAGEGRIRLRGLRYRALPA